MQMTRAEVLRSEAVIAPAQGSKCALTGGEWHSPYHDRYIQGPRGIDVGHVVSVTTA